jgi:hypothetical protein
VLYPVWSSHTAIILPLSYSNALRFCTRTRVQIVKLRDFEVFEALDYQQRKHAFREAVGEVAHMVSFFCLTLHSSHSYAHVTVCMFCCKLAGLVLLPLHTCSSSTPLLILWVVLLIALVVVCMFLLFVACVLCMTCTTLSAGPESNVQVHADVSVPHSVHWAAAAQRDVWSCIALQCMYGNFTYI